MSTDANLGEYMKDFVTVDFVAKGTGDENWILILIEEGPWGKSAEILNNLTRLQERLYGCLDVVIEGKLAEKFPESVGADIIIQVDAYNLPKKEVQEFFDRFAEGVANLPEYKEALEGGQFVCSVSFNLVFESIH